MLKSKIDVTEVLQALANSNSAMTADEVAKSVGALRPFVNPILKKMTKSGQVHEISAGADQPVRFQLIQGGLSDKPADFKATSTERAPVEAAKPVATDTKRSTRTRTSVKPTSKKQSEPKQAPKSTAAVKTQPDLQVVPQLVQSDAVSTPVIPAAFEPVFSEMEMRVLSELRSGAKMEVVMRDTLRNMRNAEEVIASLRERGIITSDFIIDERAYMLTEKAIELLEKHDEQQAAASPITAVSTSEPSSLAGEPQPSAEPVQAVLDSTVQNFVELPQESAKASSPKVSQHQPEPALAQSSSAMKSEAPRSPASDDTMSRLSALIEDLVSERMGSLEQQVRRDSEDRQQIAANINKATSALQVAIEALNEVSKQLTQP